MFRKNPDKEEIDLIAEKAFIDRRLKELREREMHSQMKNATATYKKEDKVKAEEKGRLGLFKKTGKKERPKPYKEPILLLLRKGMDAEILENVKAGEMEIKQSNNGKTVKINLDPKKIYRIPAPDGDTYRGWIHNEEEFLSYPNDIEWDAKIVTHVIREATDNYKENWDVWGRFGKIFSFKTILILFAIVMVIMVVISYSNPQFWDMLGLPMSKIISPGNVTGNVTQIG